MHKNEVAALENASNYTITRGHILWRSPSTIVSLSQDFERLSPQVPMRAPFACLPCPQPAQILAKRCESDTITKSDHTRMRPQM